MERFFFFFGIIFIFLIAFLMSNNRKAINYKTIGTGFVLQILLAVFIFKVPVGRTIFLTLGEFVSKILDFAKEGGNFVFGHLMSSEKLSEIFGAGAQIFALQLIAYFYDDSCKYSLLLWNYAANYTASGQGDE